MKSNSGNNVVVNQAIKISPSSNYIQTHNSEMNAAVMSSNMKLKEDLTRVPKSEYLNLERKFSQVSKNSEKLAKKLEEVTDELKKTKSNRDNLLKEINFLLVNLDKFKADSTEKEAIIQENKLTIRKMEVKLLQGAKNQYLLEENAKLRAEISSFKSKIEQIELEADTMQRDRDKKSSEIKVLSKALDIKVSELKYPGNIKASLLYDVGSIKSELDECRDHIEILKTTNAKLSSDIDEKNSKLKELGFAKAHLTEMLVKAESVSADYNEVNKQLSDQVNSLSKDKQIIEQYLNRMENTNKSTIEKLNKENDSFQIVIKEQSKLLKEFEEKTEKLSNKLIFLEENENDFHQALENRETELEEKKRIIEEIEAELSKANNQAKIINSENAGLYLEIKRLQDKLKLSTTRVQELETENFGLMNKNKELIFKQDSSYNDAAYENNRLQIKERKQQEVIDSLNKDIDNIQFELSNYKSLMKETLDKHSALEIEKENLEKELEQRSIQIESLKTKNLNLHKKYCQSIEKGHLLEEEMNIEKEIKALQTDDQTIINEGSKKLEEVSLIQLIRKEKEKNRDFLEDIKRLKKSMNN